MAKYLATSLAIEKVVERAAGHQELLADLDDLDELGRIGVEVDHVARFARGLRAGLHRDPDVGLGQRRRVVGPVAAHGDEAPAELFFPDKGELVLRRRLGEKVVDAGFRRDRSGGDRIVAGHHHGADTHCAQRREALLDARLHNVLQMHDPEQPAAVGDGERRSA